MPVLYSEVRSLPDFGNSVNADFGRMNVVVMTILDGEAAGHGVNRRLRALTCSGALSTTWLFRSLVTDHR